MNKIAEGSTAEIFAHSDGQILKLWPASAPQREVEYEARIGRAIYAAGLPAPAVIDVLQHEGRWGIVYQRVPGITMLQWLFEDFSRFPQAAQRLAQLHGMIHQQARLDGLPDYRERVNMKLSMAINLADAHKQVLLARLDELPPGDRLCHGDFHPQNVMMDGEKAVVIDWMDAFNGPPAADIARTLLLIDGGADQVPAEALNAFKEAYLAAYPHPVDKHLVEAWYPIMAATRLSEGVGAAEVHRLVAIVQLSLR